MTEKADRDVQKAGNVLNVTVMNRTAGKGSIGIGSIVNEGRLGDDHGSDRGDGADEHGGSEI